MKKISIILLSILCPSSLFAQETLSLQQCREMALQYNKEMAASVKQTESALYTMKSYKGNFFPNFTANGMGLYSTADGGFGIEGGKMPVILYDAAGNLVPTGIYTHFPGINLDYKVGTVYMGGIRVEQPLYMGGKIRAAYRMSVLGKEMAEMNEALTATEVILKTDKAYALVVKAQEMKKVADKYNAVLRELLSNVESAYKHGLKPQNDVLKVQEKLTASEVIVKTDQAYAQVIKAKEMKKVADKYSAVLTELMKNVESAHKHGLKPQNDVLKVQVKLNESELSIRKAENALRLATMNLCHLIGKPLVSDIRISGNYPAVEKGMDVQVSDISARPDYAILDKQVEIAGQQVRLNRSELLPKVGIMGSYDYVHGFELNDQMLMDKGSFSVLLNVSIPLFHFGERSNKVRAAKAKLVQSRLEQENMNEQMMLELTQAANNLDEARLESELSDRSLLQAEENMKVSKSQYEVGLETLSDYLEAQALWQQAYETQVDAHFQLYLNYVEYLKAAGRLHGGK